MEQRPIEGGAGERRRTIAALGPWFHNLHFPDGTQTAPEHELGDFPAFKWQELAGFLPSDLSGMTALDVGCNAGFYSFELARRGAHVLGIDREPLYLNQARWAAQEYDLTDRVEFRNLQVYDLAQLDIQFDIVLFMGVFYHLRHPLLALDILARKVKRWMVFQTMTMPGMQVAEPPLDMPLLDRERMVRPGWPTMAFIEHRVARDLSNWWAPNHSAVLAMLRSSGLRVIDQPGHEIYLCEPHDDGNRERSAMVAEELETVLRARTAR